MSYFSWFFHRDSKNASLIEIIAHAYEALKIHSALIELMTNYYTIWRN